MLTYNNGSLDDIDTPQQHIWWDYDGLWDKSVFFPEPSTGIDHITTFNTSGLVVLSETNLTVPDRMYLFKHTSNIIKDNITIGIACH